MKQRKCNCGCGKYLTEQERFESKFVKGVGCWEWLGLLDKDGYGMFGVKRKTVRAHRYSFELYKTKIKKDLVIDHLCRNPKCVNPEHLEQVTQRENKARGFGAPALNSRKTHCIANHPLKGKNLYVQPKTGKRFCRTCDRRRSREMYSRKKNITTK